MKEIIKFENVNKEYILTKRNNNSLIKIIKGYLFHSSDINIKKALDNVSFSINKGEKVAIIGKNGSGKSTLLKLIAEVAFPTSGNVIIKEKVNALLDLNAGFELDFTGRKNIYLKGILLGLSKSKIKKIENSIINFADIGEYIDYPIKYYSSGMKTRLGFAISTHIDPQILIIDEVLSVGDKQFMKKSLDKIIELTSKKNVTLILVTHSDKLAKDFCTRGIMIDNGKILFDGNLESALKIYNQLY